MENILPPPKEEFYERVSPYNNTMYPVVAKLPDFANHINS